MEKLEITEIVKRIKEEKTFEAELSDGSLTIKINRYLPYCCTAIHAGHKLRPELLDKIALDDFGRWYEEDPSTDEFISSMPITIVGNDSRFEYDLNRTPQECVHEEAWGKKVWKKKLKQGDISLSKAKHSNYYRILHALLTKLEELFAGCVLYDIHSYNYQRWDRNVPLFNIGAERVDMKKYGDMVDSWKKELHKIKITDFKNGTAINDVFFGRGYNLQFVADNFQNTLVLATEVKKVYCDELAGAIYPKVVKELQRKLKSAILNHAHAFTDKHTNLHAKKAGVLLDKTLDPALLKLDQQLHKLLRNFELLAHVNPSNNTTESKRFMRLQYTQPPRFRYGPIGIDPYSLKQELSQLRTQDISDVDIRHLYESVIGCYHDKIDLLASLNTSKFLYNSLRYFGRPSKKDLENAQYILHLPPIPSEPKSSPSLSAEAAVQSFQEALDRYGIAGKIELSKKVIAEVMVLNSRKTILIKPDAKFTRPGIDALVEHEIGVHMATTMNSNDQQLKIFNLGLPVNTETQEGLAVLSEYLSGNISIKRLKELALRVIAVDMMCSGADFMELFNYLYPQYLADPEHAYRMTTRILRGGGFTKDYLYLSGFVKILKYWRDENNLEPLLVGKTSLEFINIIEEMIEREMVQSPKFCDTKHYQTTRRAQQRDIRLRAERTQVAEKTIGLLLADFPRI